MASLMTVVGYAAVPAVAVVAGGVLASWRIPGASMRSAIQHFAAGLIFCVLATELLPDLIHRRLPWITALGFSLGVAVMLGIKHFFEGEEGNTASDTDRSSTSLLAAMGIDIALDGLLIGLGFAAGQKQGLLLTIAMVFEVFFLGVAVASSLGDAKVSIGRTLRTTGMLGGLMLAGAVAGATAVSSFPAAVIDGLLAFGVAALLFLVTEELLVEAHEVPETPFQTAMFFVGFIALFTVDMVL